MIMPEVVKVRLVVIGFEGKEAKLIQKDSPTYSKEGLHIALSTLSSYSRICISVDMKTVSIQRNGFNRTI